jgi:hypothetical protein
MSTAPAFAPLASSGPALAAAVRRLASEAQAVRELVAAGGFRDLPDASAAELTLTLHQVGQQVEAATATGVAQVADSGYPAVQGFVTPASWWRVKTKTSRDGARDQVMLARRLDRHYGATAAAWAAGRIDGEQAKTLTTGLDAVLNRLAKHLKAQAQVAGEVLSAEDLSEQIEAARVDLQARFLRLATDWGTDTLRTGIKAARQVADPDGGTAAVIKALTASTTTGPPLGSAATQ